MQQQDALLDTEEVARYLGVQPGTVIAWRHKKTGPRFVRPGNGRTIRYEPSDVRQWLRSSGWTR